MRSIFGMRKCRLKENVEAVRIALKEGRALAGTIVRLLLPTYLRRKPFFGSSFLHFCLRARVCVLSLPGCVVGVEAMRAARDGRFECQQDDVDGHKVGEME